MVEIKDVEQEKMILMALGELTAEILDGSASGFDINVIKNTLKIFQDSESEYNRGLSEELLLEIEEREK